MVTITAESENEKTANINLRVVFDQEGKKNLVLPTNLEKIEDEAFANLACEVIIIPEKCTSIGKEAFAYNSHLQYVYIPHSVTDIAPDAFEGCDNALFEYAEE